MHALTSPRSDTLGSPQSETVVFYDGACPLCSTEIDLYRDMDTEKALHMVDISNAEAALPPSLSRDTALARLHVISADGTVLIGARAFVEVWNRIPRLRWASRIASLPGAILLLEAFYRFFLIFRAPSVRGFVRLRKFRRRHSHGSS